MLRRNAVGPPEQRTLLYDTYSLLVIRLWRVRQLDVGRAWPSAAGEGAKGTKAVRLGLKVLPRDPVGIAAVRAHRRIRCFRRSVCGLHPEGYFTEDGAQSQVDGYVDAYVIGDAEPAGNVASNQLHQAACGGVEPDPAPRANSSKGVCQVTDNAHGEWHALANKYNDRHPSCNVVQMLAANDGCVECVRNGAAPQRTGQREVGHDVALRCAWRAILWRMRHGGAMGPGGQHEPWNLDSNARVPGPARPSGPKNSKRVPITGMQHR